MWRSIGAVVAGYLVMALFVMVSFTVAYLSMGTERAFQKGSYDVSLLWIVTSFVLGLIAAVVGGYVCALIAINRTAPHALATVVVLLGLLMAVPLLRAHPHDESATKRRTGEVGNFEAMQDAREPLWIALVNPFVGAAGVIIGAGMKRKPAPQ